VIGSRVERLCAIWTSSALWIVAGRWNAPQPGFSPKPSSCAASASRAPPPPPAPDHRSTARSDARSRAPSARDVAIAYCQGTPLRGEIEARDASRLEEATTRVAEAVAARFGQGAVDGRIRAIVITAAR
jgi:hypothetical protein